MSWATLQSAPQERPSLFDNRGLVLRVFDDVVVRIVQFDDLMRTPSLW